MIYKIRDEIKNKQKQSYAVGDMSTPKGVLDCSAGFNPYGTSPSAIKALSEFKSDAVKEYPHGASLERAIVDFWGAHVSLKPENVLLTNGSIGAIYLVNCAFSRQGAAVLAFSPHFSDYSEHAQFMGIKYRGVKLMPESDYRIDHNAMLDEIDGSLSLIYIDNPNNPTGQALSLDAMRDILEKAKANKVCVIADEAYGDFMEDSLSAANLLLDYDNLIVLRTFSKGFGLAGLRAGYVLASCDMCSELVKISNPYNITTPARIAAIAALGDRSFIADCRKSMAKSKAQLRGALGKNLRMAHTLDSCPIALISHADKSIDLAAEFRKQDILTYSGSDFDSLDKSSVRLRLPHERDIDLLCKAIVSMG